MTLQANPSWHLLILMISGTRVPCHLPWETSARQPSLLCVAEASSPFARVQRSTWLRHPETGNLLVRRFYILRWIQEERRVGKKWTQWLHDYLVFYYIFHFAGVCVPTHTCTHTCVYACLFRLFLFKWVQHSCCGVPYLTALCPDTNQGRLGLDPTVLAFVATKGSIASQCWGVGRGRHVFSLYLITVYWRWCSGRLPLEEKSASSNSELQRLWWPRKAEKHPAGQSCTPDSPSILAGNRNLRCHVCFCLISEPINNSWSISIYF